MAADDIMHKFLFYVTLQKTDKQSKLGTDHGNLKQAPTPQIMIELYQENTDS